jgi:hypothetical protein
VDFLVHQQRLQVQDITVAVAVEHLVEVAVYLVEVAD